MLVALILAVLSLHAAEAGGGSVADDPHFVGKLGVQFDFHGELERSFCLITDKSLQVNALLRGYKDKRPFGASKPDKDGYRVRSWIKELAFLWKDFRGQAHVLHLLARPGASAARGDGFLSAVELDGETQPLPYNGSRVDIAGLKFFYVAPSTEKDNDAFDTFQLYIDQLLDCSIVMRPASKQLQTKEDAEVHFNVNFKSLEATESVHGILGQTYRNTEAQTARAVKYSLMNQWLGQPVQADDSTGDDAAFLDGDVKDYITSALNSTDCKFSAF